MLNKNLDSTQNRATAVAERLNSKIRASAEAQRPIGQSVKEYRDALQRINPNSDADTIEKLIKSLNKDKRIQLAAKYELLLETKQHLTAILGPIENHSAAAQATLFQLNKGLKKVEDKIEKFPQSSRQAYFAANEYVLSGYAEQMRSGRIVQVPYVREVIERCKQGLSSKSSVTLYGETGGGKTEMARVIAQEVTGKEALLVRCYFGMPVSDIFGSQSLQTSEGKYPHSSEALKNLAAEADKWTKQHPKASSEERMAALNRIYSPHSATVSKFINGAIYQAAAEGRVLILDEFNTLPDNIRLSINDILTKKPGESIQIPESGESIKVAPGFGIIQTANINLDGQKRYSGRSGIEASQHERSHFECVSHLPQTLLRGLKDNPGIVQSQLFAIAIASVLNKDLSLTATPQNLDDSPAESIWRLCQLAATTQLVFANKLDAASEYIYLENGLPVKCELSVQISNRRLIQILDTWKRSGTHEPLENILLEQIVNQPTELRERRYLYQLAQAQGFFQEETGWPAPHNLGSLNDFEKLERSTSSKDLVTLNKDAVISSVFGHVPTGEVQIEKANLMQELSALLSQHDEKIAKWKEQLASSCPLTTK